MSFSGINRVVIAGVGLIGGSVGLALKKAGFQGKIIGLGRRWSSLKNAIDAKAVDSATMDFEEALKDADLLIIATPVDTISSIARESIKYVKKGCILTDVGSTKGYLVSEMEGFMPPDIYFVGAHPMSGSHNTGVGSAYADLFRGSKCIITPTKSTNPDALNIVSELWQMMGAHVTEMSPQEHDCLIGAVSHLSHVVASALTQIVGSVKNERGNAIDFAGGGFKDTTRIAASDPEIWKGILMQNADIVSSMIKKMEDELAEMRNALDNGDENQIVEKLEQAKRIRELVR